MLHQFEETVVVLRNDDFHLQAELVSFVDDRVGFCLAPDSEKGMGSSLSNAIPSVHHWQGAFVALADMPYVRESTLKLLIENLNALIMENPIVVPTYLGLRGHPVGFHCSYFDELAKLTGDTGAKSILSSHNESIIELAVEDIGVLKDIDRVGDLVTN